MTTAERLMTVEEFDEMMSRPEFRDRHMELIDGRVVEKPMPTEEHSDISGALYRDLFNYLTPKKMGRVFFEARYKTGERNARQPDVAVRLNTAPSWPKGSAPYMPDIAIEVQSPDDSIKGLRDKASYYLSVGVQMVILVLTFKKLVVVLTPDDEQIFTVEDTLTLSLLPDFALPVHDIFADPLAEEPKEDA